MADEIITTDVDEIKDDQPVDEQIVDEVNQDQDVEVVDEVVESEEAKPQEPEPTRAERRIAQLTASRKAAKEEADALRAELEREREERAKFEAEYAKVALNDRNSKRADLYKQIEEARFDADYDKVATLQLELDSMPNPPQQPPPQMPPPVPPADIPDEQKSWLKANSWFTNPSTLDERRAKQKADNLYDELVSLGYDPNDPELYDELSKELDKSGLNVGRKPIRGSSVDSGSISSGGVAPPGQRNSQRPQLTKADLKFMSMAGLNPNSQKDRRLYLNSDINKGF